MRLKTFILLIAIFTGMSILVSCSESGTTGKENHPVIGDWQGTIVVDGGREAFIALRVDASQSPLRAALTYYSLGAADADCIDVSVEENSIKFRFDQGKYDMAFEATLSGDKKELNGTFAVPQGSTSAIESGSIHFTRVPRAVDLPNAMKFSKSMEDDIGVYSMSITLAETDEGQWVAMFDIPQKSLNKLLLFDVHEEVGVIYGTVHFFGPSMDFEMSLNEDQSTLSGKWINGRSEVELNLSRVN